MAGSECSSGCESGWTHYLEKSLPSSRSISYEDCDGEGGGFRRIGGVGGEEEDLSMVSDASSGPPHFIDSSYNHGCCYGSALSDMVAVDGGAALGRSNKGRRQRNREVKQRMLLDDTASSRPLFDYAKRNEFGLRNDCQDSMDSRQRLFDFSHGYSTTHFQDGAAAINHFGHHQYQPNQYFGGDQWMGFK